MRELILNPVIIITLLMVMIVYLALIFESLSKSKVAQKLDTPLMLVSMIGMFPIIFPPFVLAHPQRYTVGNLGFIGGIITISIQFLYLFLIKKICFQNLIQNTIILLNDPFLVVLMGMAIASGLWSQTPEITFRSSLAFVIVAFLAAQFSQRCSLNNIEKLLRYSLTLTAIPSLFVTLFLSPLRPFGDPWGGIFPSSKSFASLMALNASLWLIQSLNKSKFFSIPTLATFLSTALVILTNSKSQLVTLFILFYLIAVFKLVKLFKPKQSVVIIVFSIILSIFLYLSINATIDVILASLGKDMTLTGRTGIWSQIIEEIFNHPIGYSYNGFWQPWRGSADPAANIGSGLGLGEYRPPHSHNGFYEIGLQLGYIGLFIFLMSFIKTFLSLIWKLNFTNEVTAFAPTLIIIYLFMANLSETEYLGLIGPNYACFLYIILATKPNLEKEKVVNLRLAKELN